MALPFSILGRIGGDATVGRFPASPAESAFQYPRSDRRRCNLLMAVRVLVGDRFLSVSSVGSEAMQRKSRMHSWRGQHDLSVSSVGSEAMQPPPKITPQPPIRTFSILGRIGGDATIGELAERLYYQLFQYPRSDRRRCNYSVRLAAGGGRLSFSILGRIGGDATTRNTEPPNALQNFQYPRSDRRRCNAHLCAAHLCFHIPFSILGRIGGDATYVAILLLVIEGPLSVSSVGSEAMQRQLVKEGR